MRKIGASWTARCPMSRPPMCSPRKQHLDAMALPATPNGRFAQRRRTAVRRFSTTQQVARPSVRLPVCGASRVSKMYLASARPMSKGPRSVVSMVTNRTTACVFEGNASPTAAGETAEPMGVEVVAAPVKPTSYAETVVVSSPRRSHAAPMIAPPSPAPRVKVEMLEGAAVEMYVG